MTTGDALDFGDLTAGNQYGAGASNGHGGTMSEFRVNSITNREAEMPICGITTFGSSVCIQKPNRNAVEIEEFMVVEENTKPTNSNIIDFITISTLGDALDFEI